MAGGLGSLLLFIKQNLSWVKKYIHATIKGTSTFTVTLLAVKNIEAIIRGDSSFSAILYNYLADKRIENPSKTISDDIPIAIPIIPEAIIDSGQPIDDPIFSPIIQQNKIVFNRLEKSSVQVTNPILPSVVMKKVPKPIEQPIIQEAKSNSIIKTGTKLIGIIRPTKIIGSKKAI